MVRMPAHEVHTRLSIISDNDLDSKRNETHQIQLTTTSRATRHLEDARRIRVGELGDLALLLGCLAPVRRNERAVLCVVYLPTDSEVSQRWTHRIRLLLFRGDAPFEVVLDEANARSAGPAHGQARHRP